MLDCHVSHNRDHFSVLVDEEQEYFRWQSEKIDLLVSTLHDLGPGGTLADVGCFTGMATEAFRSTGFERAVGFDLSREALKLAAARGFNRVHGVSARNPVRRPIRNSMSLLLPILSSTLSTPTDFSVNYGGY